MSGCTGCFCRQTRSNDDSTPRYKPLSMNNDREDLDDLELIISNDKHGDSELVNLTLTRRGLLLVKRKSGALHSLKLGNFSSSSTRLIPYLYLLSFTQSNHDHLEIQALIPCNKQDSNSKLKLWKLSGKIQQQQQQHDEVREWIKTGQERAYKGVKNRNSRNFHVIVNPIGGKGLAKTVWESHVKPVLDAAKIQYSVSLTGKKGDSNHAYELGKRHDSKKFDRLVAVSGDGIVHELLNGLANHVSRKGKKALRETPIVHIPCGSGNALATSIVGNDKVGDYKYCTLVGLKGKPLPIDLCSITQSNGQRLFSFLTQAFGIMADLDLGTEHLRFLGDFRFTLGYIKGSFARRKYPIKLTVLVENSNKLDIARRYNSRLGAAVAQEESTEGEEGDGDDDDEIPSLKYGTPSEPLPEEIRIEMEQKRYLDHLPKDGEMDGQGKWWTIDLLPQARDDGEKEKKGVFFLYGGKMPWISKDVMLFPPSLPNSGLIDLCLVSPMSPLEALTAMDSSETGSMYLHPSLIYLQTKAYRLSFPHNNNNNNNNKNEKEMGYVSIDGEKLKHQDFNVEVHQGLARVIALDGKLMGSKPIQGV